MGWNSNFQPTNEQRQIHKYVYGAGAAVLMYGHNNSLPPAFIEHGHMVLSVDAIKSNSDERKIAEIPPGLCKLRIRVEDTGIGMSNHELDHAFNAFWHGDHTVITY